MFCTNCLNDHRENESCDQAPKDRMKEKGCPRCALGDHGRAKRADGIKHKATVPAPGIETLEAAMFDGDCETTDGCTVEPDGHCQHGHSSWLLVMGLI